MKTIEHFGKLRGITKIMTDDDDDPLRRSDIYNVEINIPRSDDSFCGLTDNELAVGVALCNRTMQNYFTDCMIAKLNYAPVPMPVCNELPMAGITPFDIDPCEKYVNHNRKRKDRGI